MDDVSFCKLPKDDGTGFFRVQVVWSITLLSFRITILENNVGWSGKLSSEDAKRFSSNLGMSPEEYMSITYNALSTQGGENHFIYVIEGDKFMWKRKVDDNEHLMYRFGSILLEVVPTFEMIDCMIDAVIDLNSNLFNKVKCLEEEKNKLTSENQQLSDRLTLYIQKKIEMENTLYSKFIDILNAKKRKITSLQEELDKSSTTKEMDNQTNRLVPCKKTKLTGKKKLTEKNKNTIKESVNKKIEGQNFWSKLESSKQKRKLSEAASSNHYDSETEIDDSDTESGHEMFHQVLKLDSDSGEDDKKIEDKAQALHLTEPTKPDVGERLEELVAIGRVVETSVSSPNLTMDREARREHNTSHLFDLLGL